jgi:exopolysaccharide production protein ExoY
MRESIARLRTDSANRVVAEYLRYPPLGGAWKRACDVAIAGLALLVLMPLMLATAVLIRLLTEGSIFLSERLIGRGGRIFLGYRFRMPVAKSETASRWANHILKSVRASSLDQLPQLINVIRGDMSLVGPRPRSAAECSDYLTREQECLRARPGFISIWQSYYPAVLDEHAEIELDRHYVCNWSARLDFALLCKAIFAIRRADPA